MRRRRGWRREPEDRVMKTPYRISLLLSAAIGCGGAPFVATIAENDHATVPNDPNDSGQSTSLVDGATPIPDSSSPDSAGPPPPPGEFDSGEVSDGGQSGTDSGGERDGDGGPDQDAMGSLGWPCTASDSCYGAWSICNEGQGYCTGACDAGCPSGYECSLDGTECVR